MLLSSSLFKLYSRRCDSIDVDNATKEIDCFLEGLDRLNYKKEMKTYNSHILVHMPYDRIKRAPLANHNAYSYENQLRLYKKGFLSNNPRVETLALKTFLKIKLDLDELNEVPGENFRSVHLVKNTSVDLNYKEFLNRKLNLVTNSGIGFYIEAKNRDYRFRSIVHFKHQHSDCFIRINNIYLSCKNF